jgi:hypothetical protein
MPHQNQKQLSEATPQTKAEVIDISLSEKTFYAQHLWGCHIDKPQKQEKIDSGNEKMEVMGWVLGKKYRVVAVEIISDGNILQTVPIDKERPGVGKAFPHVKEAKNSGFATTVRVPQQVSESELFLQARLEDESRISVGKIKIRSVPSQSIEEVDWETSDRTQLAPPKETIQPTKVEIRDIGFSLVDSKNYCSPDLDTDSKVEIISVHVPKTAGTTFREQLIQAYGKEKVFLDYKKQPVMEVLSEIKSLNIRAIHGHFKVQKYDDYFPEAKRIIWIREPIKRLISNYWHQVTYFQNRKVLLNEVKLEKKKLLDYANRPGIRNLVSSHCGQRTIEDFWYVGITEFMEEDLVEIQTTLGLQKLEIANLNKHKYPRIYSAFVKEVLSDPEMIEQLKAINSKDLEIYENALIMREERRKSLLKTLPPNSHNHKQENKKVQKQFTTTTPQAQVEIIDISLSKIDSQHLWGCNIARPQKRDNKMEIMGWILGKSSRAVAVEIISQGSVLQTVPIDVKRPDIAKAFPRVKKAKNSGFVATVGLLGLPMASELTFQAVLADGSHIPVGTLVFRRLQALTSAYRPKLKPLAISSVGPSGAEKLLQLLVGHPSLAGMGNYADELPPGQYWLRWLKAFSQEENSDLEELASFCQQTIDGFYSRVNTRKSEISYFIERYDASRPEFLNLLSELYPEAKEIILVRDFRDVVYSMLPFSRRKCGGFERKRFKSYQQFVYEFCKDSVGGLLQRWQERSPHVHLVKYEDLILSPGETLSGILEYLGLDNSQETLDVILSQKSQEQSKQEPPVGDWQYEMPVSLQILSSEVCQAALQEFGYI